MELHNHLDGAARFVDSRDLSEFPYIRFVMIPSTPEEEDAYSAGRRAGLLSGIVLGSISAAIMVLVLCLLLM